MVYAEQGKNALAEKYISEGIKLLEELKDYYAISDYLTYMSDIYVKKNEWDYSIEVRAKKFDAGLKNMV